MYITVKILLRKLFDTFLLDKHFYTAAFSYSIVYHYIKINFIMHEACLMRLKTRS